jgi:hypothetical protein
MYLENVCTLRIHFSTLVVSISEDIEAGVQKYNVFSHGSLEIHSH